VPVALHYRLTRLACFVSIVLCVKLWNSGREVRPHMDRRGGGVKAHRRRALPLRCVDGTGESDESSSQIYENGDRSVPTYLTAFHFAVMYAFHFRLRGHSFVC
jgi:hypothetical protein